MNDPSRWDGRRLRQNALGATGCVSASAPPDICLHVASQERSFSAMIMAVVASVILGLAWCEHAVGAPSDSEQAARERRIQEEVLAEGRQLVGSVLDVQLRQLVENGLGEEEFFKDLRWIRDHLDMLLEHDMPGTGRFDLPTGARSSGRS